MTLIENDTVPIDEMKSMFRSIWFRMKWIQNNEMKQINQSKARNSKITQFAESKNAKNAIDRMQEIEWLFIAEQQNADRSFHF